MKNAFFVPNVQGPCHVCPSCDSDPNSEPQAHLSRPHGTESRGVGRAPRVPVQEPRAQTQASEDGETSG